MCTWACVSPPPFPIPLLQVQSLRLSIQPNVTEGASKVRNYFLLVIAILQPLLMLWLTFGLLNYSAIAVVKSDGLDLESNIS